MNPFRTLPRLVALVALALPLHGFGHTTANTAGHSSGHGSHAGHGAAPRPFVASEVVKTPFGQRGDPARVTRTLEVEMRDTMRFSPEVLQVRRGETVRIRLVNTGRVQHEFVLGTPQELRRHAEMMKANPAMAHDEPHMVHVAPGRRGELVWQFTEAGEFDFACLLPGHFEAGMMGKVSVR